MVTVASFFQTFPEFERVRPQVVQGAIARAMRWIDLTVWGAQADDGTAFLTAAFIDTSPMGGMTRLIPDKTSTYFIQYEELRETVTCGWFPVAGGR